MKKMWKDVLIFYLTSFVFGGTVFALIYVVKPQEIMLKNKIVIDNNSYKTILLGAGISFFVIITAFKLVKTKILKKDMFCEIEIKINETKIKTISMIDTGNLLKEPITNTPVIILEHTLLYQCVPKEILNNLNNILGGELSKISEKIKQEYMSKLKFIPFSSLGKQNGMLVGIKAQYLKVKQEDKEKINENIIIGIYDKSLTKRGEYRALIGIDLL